MAISDGDLKKIKGAVEETIHSEKYLKEIKGAVEETIHSEKYLKEIGRMITVGIGEALDQMVLPELMKIEKKMATKQDIAELEERLGKRIDKVAETVTDTRTNHERRIRRLEDEVGVEPEARLI